MFQRILCPIDFSEAATGVVRYGSAFAERFDASITLLHVAPPADFAYTLSAPLPSRLVEYTEHRNRLVQRSLDSFADQAGIRNAQPPLLVEGDAAEEIVRVAREEAFDLILMPTHGSGAIKRWLLVGSVTTKVLHRAQCPVLAGVDFRGLDDPFPSGRLLCGIDLGPQSEQVLCAAMRLARTLDAELTIVHAAPAFGAALGDFVDENWRRTIHERLRNEIVSLQQKIGAAGRIVIENGNPHEVVSRVAKRLEPDLVVIGRGASTGLLGRLRADVYEIIRYSPVPVLSV
jgi:nucleotide-binding universal stress UspA family protein